MDTMQYSIKENDQNNVYVLDKSMLVFIDTFIFRPKCERETFQRFAIQDTEQDSPFVLVYPW